MTLRSTLTSLLGIDAIVDVKFQSESSQIVYKVEYVLTKFLQFFTVLPLASVVKDLRLTKDESGLLKGQSKILT